MAPTLRDGERVFARRVPTRLLCRGEVVVFRLEPGNPPSGLLVKRLVALPGDDVSRWLDEAGFVPPGCVVVLGDSPDSYDSRQFGYLPIDDIIATVAPLGCGGFLSLLLSRGLGESWDTG